MKFLIFIVLLACDVGYNHCHAQSSDSNIVCEINEEGVVVTGSLESLLLAVRQGKNIRVGWEIDLTKPSELTIEHWSDAGFLTIFKGHLFAQIESIFEQAPAPMTPPQVMLVDSKPDGWVGVIGTTGILRSNYKGPSEKPIMEIMELTESRVRTKWAVLD